MSSVIFVGTGPINLLKGFLILRDAPNTSIKFIDKNEKIGGAWYSDISPKNFEIECGCHIWTYCPEAYNFIEKELGIKLVKMKPAPIFRYNKLSFSYPLKSIKDSYTRLIKNSPKRILGGRSVSKENPEVYWNLFNRQNKYPEMGSQVLVSRLIELLTKYKNVSFELSTTIRSILVDDTISLITKNEEFVADQLYLTSLSSIESVQTKSEIIHLQHNRIDYIHFLISADRTPNYKANYHRLIGDPIIHRLTDISYQTKNKEQLFLIGIHEEAYKKYSQKEILIHFKEYLKKDKLYEKSIKLELIKEHIFPTYYINENQRVKLKAIDPRVHLLHSTDLMHGIYYTLKEHQLV